MLILQDGRRKTSEQKSALRKTSNVSYILDRVRKNCIHMMQTSTYAVDNKQVLQVKNIVMWSLEMLITLLFF